MALDSGAKRKAKLLVLKEIKGLMSKMHGAKMKGKLSPPAESEEAEALEPEPDDEEVPGDEGDDLALLMAAKKKPFGGKGKPFGKK